MPLAPGTLLNNRYRIVSILGQGGMGAVYRASDEHLHIAVAVKENLFLTEEYGRQFRREAHILAGLRHSNLPHVTDYFSMENQVQYLVMDYIEGEDLRQRMERMGSLPERETMLIGISICDALQYLHTRRPPIVHRDIKPGNIKVTPDGQAVLVDFGLAKIMQGSQATSTGARAMTPGYSPPEQYGTARTDPRSDIYSLGATLYAALTGVIPEDGLARMTGRSRLTPVRDLAPKVNRRLADCIERALEIDPEDRYQTADECKAALIESGELSVFYPEAPVITPPPAEGSEQEINGILKEDLENEPASRISRPTSWTYRSKRQRERLIKKGLATAGVALLITLVAFMMSPFTGLFNPMGTNPNSAPSTEVLSMNSSPVVVENTPTQETPAVTQTEMPVPPVVEQTETATPEPSATLAPTKSESPSPTATPFGGGYSQIAFASDMGGTMEIWLIDVKNRSNLRQLTNMPGGSCQPTWSPDGMKLAFTSPCRQQQDTYPGSRIYMINVDGTGLTQLTNSLEGDFDPAWSPRGDRIAYTSLSEGDNTAIFVLNLSDMSTEHLSKSKYADKHPAWSPDGMRLAFVRRRVNTTQVMWMPSTGSPQKDFTVSGNVSNLWPAWSPDGSRIFFSQTSNDAKSVPVLKYMKYEDRETSNERRVPAEPNGKEGPFREVAPSPDGNWLAYESWPDGVNHDIYIVDSNGIAPDQLTTDRSFDWGPVWRPNSTEFTP